MLVYEYEWMIINDDVQEKSQGQPLSRKEIGTDCPITIYNRTLREAELPKYA
jgi:hypothetical protein